MHGSYSSHSIKLITLNIWGGHVRDPLVFFIKKYNNVDFFCIQEVYHDAVHKISSDDRKVNLKVFSDLQLLLPQHASFFKPVVNNTYGIGMYVHKRIETLDDGDILIHKNNAYPGIGPTHSRNLQWVKCRSDGKIFYVINIHGLWNGMGKTDTPARIKQSKKIKEFIDMLNAPVILCGDFNLRPDTESIKIIENAMTNLINIYEVRSTRSSLYSKPEKFADYIFTSPEIRVNSFNVLQDVVSDHAPLLLDFGF